MFSKARFCFKIGWSCTNPFSTYYNVKTIFALSSGHGKCGVAVIRVSGPNAGDALKCLTNLSTLPKPRYALLRNIQNPKTGDILDQGLILWFPGPKSFTGEDSCEFQVHGGVAVVSAILNALGSIENLRLAEPGEFTRRAFHNGKLDLTEVEGLADLLQAETEAQRKQAFLQSQGFLSKTYNRWKEILLRSVAHIEAHIDFEETEALDANVLNDVRLDIEKLSTEIQQHLADGRKGECLRNGVRTVILGEPNVGKSSLLNCLCQRPAAIVSPIEGTTRDLLEITLDVGGYPLVLIDTAGLRSKTEDVIEKEGISRALQTYESANLVILVIDCSKYLHWIRTHPSSNFMEFISQETNNIKLNSILKSSDDAADNKMFAKQCVIVFNKFDLVEDKDKHNFKQLEEKVHFVSCKTETGFGDLISKLTENLKHLCGVPTEHASMNQARHRQHLNDCLKKINQYLNLSASSEVIDPDVVLLAEHLRVALRHLGKLTGSVTNEELLDLIFRDFCIGK